MNICKCIYMHRLAHTLTHFVYVYISRLCVCVCVCECVRVYVCSQDQHPTRPSPIPSQRRLTHQLPKQEPQFKALRQHYAGTHFEEQRQLHLPQKHKATVRND